MRIALLRPGDRVESALRFCRENGLDAGVAPAIEIHDIPVDKQGLAHAMSRADICIFMSSTAVERLFDLEPDARRLIQEGDVTVIAVGEATARKLGDQSIASRIPETFSSGGLVDYVLSLQISGRMVVVFRSDMGTTDLRQGLEEAGYTVSEFALYGISMPGNTKPLRDVISQILGGEEYILPFSSSMAVRNFFTTAVGMAPRAQMLKALSRCRIWAIGEATASELSRQGVGRFRTAGRADFMAMLGEIVRAVQE